jgi:DNA-binding transcriptional regulator YiaG
MPNLSQVLKAEITRISRREIKSSVSPIRSSNFVLKRTVAALKKRIAVLESENKRFIALQNELQEKKCEAQIAQVQNNKIRITSQSIKALRAKLGLSQDSLAMLLGMSGNAIYLMERKGGRLRLRTSTMTKLMALRGIGKREAVRKLEEIEGKSKKLKKTGVKKAKKKGKKK